MKARVTEAECVRIATKECIQVKKYPGGRILDDTRISLEIPEVQTWLEFETNR